MPLRLRATHACGISLAVPYALVVGLPVVTARWDLFACSLDLRGSHTRSTLVVTTHVALRLRFTLPRILVTAFTPLFTLRTRTLPHTRYALPFVAGYVAPHTRVDFAFARCCYTILI